MSRSSQNAIGAAFLESAQGFGAEGGSRRWPDLKSAEAEALRSIENNKQAARRAHPTAWAVFDGIEDVIKDVMTDKLVVEPLAKEIAKLLGTAAGGAVSVLASILLEVFDADGLNPGESDKVREIDQHGDWVRRMSERTSLLPGASSLGTDSWGNRYHLLNRQLAPSPEQRTDRSAHRGHERELERSYNEARERPVSVRDREPRSGNIA